MKSAKWFLLFIQASALIASVTFGQEMGSGPSGGPPKEAILQKPTTEGVQSTKQKVDTSSCPLRPSNATVAAAVEQAVEATKGCSAKNRDDNAKSRLARLSASGMVLQNCVGMQAMMTDQTNQMNATMPGLPQRTPYDPKCSETSIAGAFNGMLQEITEISKQSENCNSETKKNISIAMISAIEAAALSPAFSGRIIVGLYSGITGALTSLTEKLFPSQQSQNDKRLASSKSFNLLSCLYWAAQTQGFACEVPAGLAHVADDDDKAREFVQKIARPKIAANKPSAAAIDEMLSGLQKDPGAQKIMAESCPHPNKSEASANKAATASDQDEVSKLLYQTCGDLDVFYAARAGNVAAARAKASASFNALDGAVKKKWPALSYDEPFSNFQTAAVAEIANSKGYGFETKDGTIYLPPPWGGPSLAASSWQQVDAMTKIIMVSAANQEKNDNQMPAHDDQMGLTQLASHLKSDDIDCDAELQSENIDSVRSAIAKEEKPWFKSERCIQQCLVAKSAFSARFESNHGASPTLTAISDRTYHKKCDSVLQVLNSCSGPGLTATKSSDGKVDYQRFRGQTCNSLKLAGSAPYLLRQKATMSCPAAPTAPSADKSM